MPASRLGVVAVLVAVALAAAAAGIWFAVSRDDAAHPPASESVQMLLESPEDYYGRRVTIRGSVSGELTPNAFTLGDPQPDPSDLLVVRYDRQVTVEQNQVVNVTGVVREFRLSDYDARVDVGDVNAGILDAFQDRPVIVADEVAEIR